MSLPKSNQCLYLFPMLLGPRHNHWVLVLKGPVQNPRKARAFRRGSVNVLSWIAFCLSPLHVTVCLTPSVGCNSLRKANACTPPGFPGSSKQGALHLGHAQSMPLGLPGTVHHGLGLLTQVLSV